MANFIYIMGKSSAGKDTIYQSLKDKINTNIYVPYTTRPMRNGEKQGREYNFISREEFKKLEFDKKVMEHRDYNVINAEGEKDIWTYATIADEQLKKDGDFLTIGTLESYTSILEYAKNNTDKNINLIPIYISIDEKERQKRAKIRESKQEKPNYEEMKRRLEADNIDFSQENLKKAEIGKKETFQNYDLDNCVNQIVEYVEKERKKKLNLRKKYKVDINIDHNKKIENNKKQVNDLER